MHRGGEVTAQRRAVSVRQETREEKGMMATLLDGS